MTLAQAKAKANVFLKRLELNRQDPERKFLRYQFTFSYLDDCGYPLEIAP